MKKMKVAVLGTQASGKGTQSHIISVLMGVTAVSVGDLLRVLQKEDSARGRATKLEMSKGSFVPDDIILPLVKEWTAKNPKGWVVDGFPRTLEQAEKCADFFRPDVVIYLEVPDAESKRRISYRRVCSNCNTNYNLITQPPLNPKGLCDVCGGTLIQRADDTPQLVEERLRHYHEITQPLKEWFGARHQLVLIDGSSGIPEVAREIQRRLEEFERRKLRKRKAILWVSVFFALLLATAITFTVTGYILNS
jgi:adenylate kinase